MREAASQRAGGLTSKIKNLKDAKAQAQEDKKQAAKELRNAERRRRRLKKKAKELPPADLVEILALRQEQKRARQEKEGAAAEDSDEKAGPGRPAALCRGLRGVGGEAGGDKGKWEGAWR